MNILSNKTFPQVPLSFNLVTLILEFNPFFENFNLANNYQIASVRALIFHSV